MRFSITRRRSDEPSYGITTAESSHLSDISKRQRQYVITMLFRIVALLVVVLVPGLTLIERAVLGLIATVIPYVAVIRANGGSDQAEAPTNLMIGSPRQGELPGPDRSLGGAHRIDAEGEPVDGPGEADEASEDGDAPAHGERRERVDAEWTRTEADEQAEAPGETPAATSGSADS